MRRATTTSCRAKFGFFFSAGDGESLLCGLFQWPGDRSDAEGSRGAPNLGKLLSDGLGRHDPHDAAPVPNRTTRFHLRTMTRGCDINGALALAQDHEPASGNLCAQ